MKEHHKTEKARKELYMSKQQEKYNSVRRIANFPTATIFRIFKASFGEGGMSVSILAEQLAKANFISKTLLQKFHQ